jgi:hypothetical protein
MKEGTDIFGFPLCRRIEEGQMFVDEEVLDGRRMIKAQSFEERRKKVGDRHQGILWPHNISHSFTSAPSFITILIKTLSIHLISNSLYHLSVLHFPSFAYMACSHHLSSRRKLISFDPHSGVQFPFVQHWNDPRFRYPFGFIVLNNFLG